MPRCSLVRMRAACAVAASVERSLHVTRRAIVPVLHSDPHILYSFNVYASPSAATFAPHAPVHVISQRFSTTKTHHAAIADSLRGRGVRVDLHFPPTAWFQDMLYNKDNVARRCGQLCAYYQRLFAEAVHLIDDADLVRALGLVAHVQGEEQGAPTGHRTTTAHGPGQLICSDSAYETSGNPFALDAGVTMAKGATPPQSPTLMRSKSQGSGRHSPPFTPSPPRTKEPLPTQTERVHFDFARRRRTAEGAPVQGEPEDRSGQVVGCGPRGALQSLAFGFVTNNEFCELCLTTTQKEVQQASCEVARLRSSSGGFTPVTKSTFERTWSKHERRQRQYVLNGW